MMLMFMLFSIFCLILLFFMMLMNFIISKKLFKNLEKMSTFECGFDPISMNRMPFSLQFYLVTLIFLIFDVEIVLILPMVKSMQFFINTMILSMLILMIILLIGLFLEWKEGALQWYK